MAESKGREARVIRFQGWGFFPQSRLRSVLKAVVSCSKSLLTCCSVEFECAGHVFAVLLLKLVPCSAEKCSTLKAVPCTVVILVLLAGR